MAKRDAIFPAGRQALYEINRYSAAIRSGDFLFVSGQVGSREDGSPEPVFEKQVQLAFDNLAAVLKAADCTFDDAAAVRCTGSSSCHSWCCSSLPGSSAELSLLAAAALASA